MQVHIRSWVVIGSLTLVSGCAAPSPSGSGAPDPTGVGVAGPGGGTAGSGPAGGGGGGGGGAGGGGGGGGGGMQLVTTGLFLVDAPVTGEPAIAGMVHAIGGRHVATPPDTVVTLNGVALVPWSV